jgi:hypothetical protein
MSKFPDSSYGEDWKFARPLCFNAKTEIHIPKVLHRYIHNSKTTEAPPYTVKGAGASLASDMFRRVTGQ